MKKYEPILSIKQWAEEDRPREKLLLKGRKHLSNAELLAIILGSGTRKETAVDISKKLLNAHQGNLFEISKLSLRELTEFSGIGKARAVSIMAALELANRKNSWEPIQRKAIHCSKDVFDILSGELSECLYEEFWILLLNRANKILNKVRLSEGGLSGTVADPRKIFKIAIEHQASSVILCHNHPSGNVKPSESDINLTKKIVTTGNIMDITILDHVIIGEREYYSFADENML
ncbi:MAG: DNA repair protein RadC [Bacteroidetes bacterium]|nr:DNA repair protein RadC [Bacteroidota bacterium]